MTVGDLYETIRGPHVGERVRIIKFSNGKVFFQAAPGSRIKNRKEYLASERHRFELAHRKIG